MRVARGSKEHTAAEVVGGGAHQLGQLGEFALANAARQEQLVKRRESMTQGEHGDQSDLPARDRLVALDCRCLSPTNMSKSRTRAHISAYSLCDLDKFQNDGR